MKSRIEWLNTNVYLANINVNVRILSLILLYVFGFYGWGTGKNFAVIGINLTFALTCLLLLIIVAFYTIEKRVKWEIKYSYQLKLKDFIIVIGIFLILLYLNRNSINESLSIDELAYAKLTSIHGYELSFIIANIQVDVVKNWQMANLVQLLSFIVLVLFAIFVIFAFNLKNNFRYLVLLTTSIVGSRIILSEFAGNASQHSPLFVVPYQIASTIFGVTDTVYRLCGILLFSLFFTVILRLIAASNSMKNLSVLLTLGYIFLPLSRVSVVLLDPVIWSFFCISILILSQSYCRNTNKDKLLVFLAISSYFRITVLIAFMLFWIFQNSRFFTKRHKLEPQDLILGLFVLPNLVATVISRLRQIDSMEKEWVSESFLERLHIFSDTLIDSGNLFVFIVALFLTFVAVVCCQRNLWICVMFCFFIVFYVFLLPSELLGNSKYLLEYIYPFLCSSIIVSGSMSRNRKVIGLVVFTMMSLLLSQMNKFDILSSQTRKVQQSSPSRFDVTYKYSPRLSYDYQQSFDYLQNRNLSCANIGVVYGNFAEILGNLDVRMVRESSRYTNRILLWQKSNGQSIRFVSIELLDISEAKCAIISSVDNQVEFLESLRDTKWNVTKSFHNSVFGTFVYILEKD